MHANAAGTRFGARTFHHVDLLQLSHWRFSWFGATLTPDVFHAGEFPA